MTTAKSSKFSPALHAPLLSGSNAVSGSILLGALIATGAERTDLAVGLWFSVLLLAAVEVVSHLVAIHRLSARLKQR